jgi:lysophospholipase L1-like esterase
MELDHSQSSTTSLCSQIGGLYPEVGEVRRLSFCLIIVIILITCLPMQLVLFGANDACLPGSPSKQHVPLEKYRENIKTILTHPSITGHNPTILLVTPPPVNEFHLDESAIANGSDATRRQATTAQYAIAIREIANEFKDRKVKLVDLWSAILNEAAGSDHISPAELGHFEGPPILGSKEKGECKGLRKLLVDGLHFTGEGYRVFSKEVIPLVGPTWTQEPLTAPVTWVFP